MSEAHSDINKKVLLGMTTAELKEVARSLGMPSFAGEQIARWIYEKRVMSIDEMNVWPLPTALAQCVPSTVRKVLTEPSSICFL